MLLTFNSSIKHDLSKGNIQTLRIIYLFIQFLQIHEFLTDDPAFLKWEHLYGAFFFFFPIPHILIELSSVRVQD